MNIFVKSDLYRYRGKTSKREFFIRYFRNPEFRYFVTYRLKTRYSNWFEKVLGKVLWKIKPLSNVFIGANVIILGNVMVGDESIIGAGSVVTKNVQKRCVYAGNYAKKIKDVDDTMLKNHCINPWKDCF